MGAGGVSRRARGSAGVGPGAASQGLSLGHAPAAAAPGRGEIDAAVVPPSEIAGWLRRTFPSDADLQVSHETIYRTLFVQSRGVLKRELTQHLRRQRQRRQARAARGVGHYPGHLVEAVSIRHRPADATDRAVPGHWEGDLLMGARRASQVATLVERQSRYVLLVRIPAADTQTVVRALARRVQRLPAGLKRSLTWDRGTEFAGHRAFTVATTVQVYFCDPQSPWQRGSNENTNGLLRQYLPRGRTSPRTRRRNWMRSRFDSTHGRG